MIDVQYFEQPSEAEQTLERVSRVLGALTGTTARLRLLAELDPSTRARVEQLRDEVFGTCEYVFDQGDLSEVAADPDAMFLVLEIDGKVEGYCFGYYEEPGQETVPGTDFFLDTGLVSNEWQDRGIAGAAGAGVLLLADLLGDVHRVGISVWDCAGRGDDLARLYRRFGFVDADAHRCPFQCMAVDLDDDLVEGWRAAMGLPVRSARP